jgi:saccharopine dehydrogenase-like NADP-dependent oxidoreductase
LLGESGDYDVTLVDNNDANLQTMPAKNVRARKADLADVAAVKSALTGMDYALSTCPFFLNRNIAKIAHELGVHYFDVTEDVETTRFIKELAKNTKSALVPQCGLAPGYISIAAATVAKKFDEIFDVQMRVGALPQFPTNALKYNLTWSTDGLINEYCNPCEAIVEGKSTELPPLQSIEHFTLDGSEYEAFNTSGGIGSLGETLTGKARNVSYKTIRYPGHRDIIQILLHDLRLIERRDLLKDIFESSIPSTKQDVVLVFVTVTGMRSGRLVQENFLRKVYSRELYNRHWSAIELTTATSLCTMIDLHREGKLAKSGFIRQEDITLDIYASNRFGKYYDENTAIPVASSVTQSRRA